MTLVVGEPFQNLDSAAALLEKTSHPAEAAVFLDQLVKAVPWNPAARVRLAQAQVAAGSDAASPRSALAAIAASPAAPYDVRVQAASLLSAAKMSGDFGSAELRLLATAGSITGEEANRPFFYSARLKAAESTATGFARLPLLRAAIEYYPHRDEARISFFREAVRAEQYQPAYSALAPLLRGGFLLRNPRANAYRAPEENAAEDSADSQAPEAPSETAPPDTMSKIPRAVQAEIAAELAGALEHLGRRNESVQYFQMAIRLDSDSARRAALRRQLAAVRTVLKRQADNAARRPIIHDALEQDRTVRPQILEPAAARAAAPPPANKNTAPAAAPRRKP
jgi:tetratricopeptide (TPR) repeat protein